MQQVLAGNKEQSDENSEAHGPPTQPREVLLSKLAFMAKAESSLISALRSGILQVSKQWFSSNKSSAILL